MKNKINSFTLIVVVLTSLVVLFLWVNKTGKLQRRIDNLNGQVAGLNQTIKDHQSNILELDSMNDIKSDSLKALKRQLKVQRAENATINRLYESEQSKISKLSDSASLDYFKNETVHFPTYSVKIDSGAYFAVSPLSIRIANDKFLHLKEKTDLLVNMTGQCTNMERQNETLENMVSNREAKISEMSQIDKTKTEQIKLLQQAESNYEKILRKEKRKKTLYKITSAAGVIAWGVLIVR